MTRTALEEEAVAKGPRVGVLGLRVQLQQGKFGPGLRNMHCSQELQHGTSAGSLAFWITLCQGWSRERLLFIPFSHAPEPEKKEHFDEIRAAGEWDQRAALLWKVS